jgi:hypothetical protein
MDAAVGIGKAEQVGIHAQDLFQRCQDRDAPTVTQEQGLRAEGVFESFAGCQSVR